MDKIVYGLPVLIQENEYAVFKPSKMKGENTISRTKFIRM